MAPVPLSQAQTHPHPWGLPLTADLGTIPVWGGRRRWLAAVRITLDSRAGRRALARHHVAADTAIAVARADARVADHRTGRSVTTSHQTVASRIGSCAKTVQRARQLLVSLGLAVVIAVGRYLTAAERNQAQAATGRRIVRVASTRALTLAQHLVERVHLPRRGSVTPHEFSNSTVTKRARARAGAATGNRSRPLWLQLLAATLVSRLRHLARPGTTHIGHLCDAVVAAGVTCQWVGLSPDIDQLPSSKRRTAVRAAAGRIIDALDERNRNSGLMSLPADSQHHPIGLLAHQIRDLIDAGIDPGARAGAQQKADQRREAVRAERRARQQADRQRHEEYMAHPAGRRRIAEQLHQARLSWRRATTDHRTSKPTC